jgi:REP-associated tyrosine transposase
MKRKIVENQYYHVLNRGNNKQPIFKDNKDWVRFLFLILHLQSSINIVNVSRQVNYFIRDKKFKIPNILLKEIINNRSVELVAFILMPNHFHLIVKNIERGGISKYMQRILNSHTKYFNTKNKISGHLFQGPFKIKHIEDDPQFLYLSAYIHNNIREIMGRNQKEDSYLFSSYQDYVKENRWGSLLKPEIILDQFSNKEEYGDFVRKSGAKEPKL